MDVYTNICYIQLSKMYPWCCWSRADSWRCIQSVAQRAAPGSNIPATPQSLANREAGGRSQLAARDGVSLATAVYLIYIYIYIDICIYLYSCRHIGRNFFMIFVLLNNNVNFLRIIQLMTLSNLEQR